MISLPDHPRVCLSHFSELETGDKQAFDTHNQTPIETRIQTRFSDVVFIDPFLVGGIKRLSLRSCSAQFDPGIGTALGIRNVYANQNGFAFIAVFLAHRATIGRSKATNLWLSNQVG